jgi:hypothetical protein
VSRGDRNEPGFDDFKGDIEDAERRVAREIDPGARALVVAILVFVILLSFVLPHTGSAKGLDVLVSVGFSILALITRRWGLAWIALAGSAVACPIGMLAVWSR